MNTHPLRRYWRIPLVALLAAVLAFLASYVVYPSYESTTRLLVHGRDATFLTSTGEDLTSQPGVVDASLSQALLATYAGIATSRSVAEGVVDELKIDQQPDATGPYAAVAQGLAWAYRCGRAFITAGFCAPVDQHEKAVLDVQEGTSAEPTGTNAGGSAGTQASYVLEVRSSGRNPAEAKAVTDAVADQLVALSNDRFKRDAEQNVAGLQTQVDAAAEVAKTKTLAVATFQTKNGISASDAKQSLSANTVEGLRSDLLKARADLADTRAQLSSLEASLADVPRDERSKQTIVTGRSTTETSTDSTSSVYSDLLSKLSTAKAAERGFQARVERLTRQLANARPLAKNGPIAELVVLQQSADLATANLDTLTKSLQKAQTTAAQGSVDLSRLDPASEPTYPVKPKRYIYLALGLLLGALAGAALTAQAERRANLRHDASGGDSTGGDADGLDDDTQSMEIDNDLDLMLAGTRSDSP